MLTTLTRNHDVDGRPAPVSVPAPAPVPKDARRRRRLLAGVAGLGIAGLLAGLGTAMMSNANFSDRYVTDQLSKQRITFRAFDALTPQERESACVVANAGKPLTTGKQAECYANDFIGTHIVGIGRGRTYAELEEVRTELLAKIATAQASGDPDLPKLQKDLGELTGQREAMFKAETLRGILLTSFGFSTLGEKVAEAATVAYAAAGVLALLSLGGLVVGMRRPAPR
jgi:hypothetical protein